MDKAIIWFDQLGMGDVARVGGKNASLGEMIGGLSGAGVRVPGGFATSAVAYREFLASDGLDLRIEKLLSGLDVDDVEALAGAGATIRGWLLAAPLPRDLEQAIADAYREMEAENGADVAVAVRSSATAEDLPDASFAGQQETLLNVRCLDNVLHAVRQVFASLYNDRAIAYREHRGFAHHKVALSAGIQKMVRSDIGASGVMFTLDTESGFRGVVLVTAAYGLGETVVKGAVDPDEFLVLKENLAAGRPALLRRTPGNKAIKMVYGDGDESVCTVDVPTRQRLGFCLDDSQVEQLARYAVAIERHYGRPMDIEWALDGSDGQLYILQARPETVIAQSGAKLNERYRLLEQGNSLVDGRAIGQRIGCGPVRVIEDSTGMARVQAGDVLVTDMTDPDWEPVMKRAAAIVTNRGGRTCHAAIVARELGIPAVVGCGDATSRLREDERVTVCCAEGDDGHVYAGELKFEVLRGGGGRLPPLPAKIMLNVANPWRAFAFSEIPNDGIGLARLEFIINTTIGIHPRALLDYRSQSLELRREIDRRTAGYADPVAFYVEKLVEGIATLAAAFRGKPVIVRLSDFKSNEYANLFGGEAYEPHEENPMIGFRGAARYIADSFRPCFELECQAIRKVRNEMCLENVEVMVPFVRTLDEALAVLELLEQNGLKRGDHGLRIVMMCELPSNAVMAEEFLQYFDGFSIGSNDMTQLTLGLDRDSGLLASTFDERDPAVKKLLSMAIRTAKTKGKYIGICGQGPSDYPEMAKWLLDQGIDSISLAPDTVVGTWTYLAAAAE